MTIIFDLNGKDRKQLVKAISEITGARAEYQRMPTCAFVIDFFTVTKEGTLEFPDRGDTEIVEQVLDGLAERGFAVISSYYDNGESAMETDEDLPTETPTQPDTAAVTETEEVSEETETTAETATQPDITAVTEVEEVSEEAETTAETATQPDITAVTKVEEVSEEAETTAETATPPDTAAVTETEEVSEETKTTAQNETLPEASPNAENNGIDRFSISMQRDFFDEALFAVSVDRGFGRGCCLQHIY